MRLGTSLVAIALILLMLSVPAGPALQGALEDPADSPPASASAVPSVLPASVTGYLPWLHYVDGIVNTANGNLFFTDTDLTIRSVGLDVLQHRVIAHRQEDDLVRTLRLERAYNSGDASLAGPFGYGWTFTYGEALSVVPGSHAIYRDATGAKHNFTRTAGTYTAPQGVRDRLVDLGDGTHRLDSPNGFRRFFRSDGRLTAIDDLSGRRVDLAYAGDLISTVSGYRGLLLRFEYDGSGRVSRVYDPLDRIVSYAYDAAGDLVAVTDPTGAVSRYRYDAFHLLVDIIRPSGVGQHISFERIALEGRTVQSGLFLIRGDGSESGVLPTRTFQWAERHVVVVGPRGGRTLVQMDDRGRAIKIVDALGHTTRAWYDDENRLTRHVDGNGHGFDYAYDARGNLVGVTDPLGRSIARTFLDREDADRILSVPSSATNRRGISIGLGYDAPGRLEDVSLPMGSIRYTYDVEGNLVSVTDPRNVTTRYAWDLGNRSLQTSRPSDAGPVRWTYRYDAVGRLLDAIDPRGGTTTYEYDAMDRLVRKTDALGGETGFEYNADGSLVNETDALGRKREVRHNLLSRVEGETDAAGGVKSYEYDAAGNIIRSVDAAGRETQYEYDLLDRLTRKVDAAGNAESYAYDAVGNRVSVTDALGFTTTYAYDELDRLVRVTDPLGRSERYEYDPEGNLVRRVLRGGPTYEYAYDAMDRLTSIRDPLGSLEQFEYDGNGNLVRHVDRNGGVTLRTYDASDRLVAVRDAMGNTRGIAYDPSGNLVAYTDARGAATRYEYDALDRLVRERDALGGTTTYGYDLVGRRTSVTDARGFTTTYEYDVVGRLIRESDPLGREETYAYDAAGNRVARTDRRNGTWTFTYDALGRTLTETDPLGQVTSFAYDAVGNQISVTGPTNATRTYAYDAARRLVQEADALGGVTTYTYDDRENLLSIVDPESRVTRYAYDARDRLVRVRSPMGHTIAYHYDRQGNLVGRTDPDGRTTTYAYDAMDRLVRTTYSGGGSVSYTRDANGNVVQETSLSAGAMTIRAYAYDLLNRKLTASQTYIVDGAPSATRTARYAYDAAGRVSALMYPDGRMVRFTYDPVGRLVRLSDPVTGSYGFEYDGSGRRTALAYPDGSRLTYAYDAADRITSQEIRSLDDRLLLSRAHTYDARGNRLTTTDESGGTTTYAYDALGRLVNAILPSGESSAWTYDRVGNRLSQTTSSGTVAYTYDGDHRLLTAGSASFAYDRSGNLVRRTDASGTTRYAYDGENRLVRATLPTGVAVDYRYAGDGTRIARKVSDATLGGRTLDLTLFYYDGGNLLEERSTTATRARYLHGPSVDEPLSRSSPSGVLYDAHDTLGSAAALFRWGGSTVARVAYDPFGVPTADPGWAGPYMFTSREYDERTGLYYYRARYYDPALGRFLSKDPLPLRYPLVQSRDVNPYAYVWNDPVNFVDPTGYQGTHYTYTIGDKRYSTREYDEASLKEAGDIIDRANDEVQRIAAELNRQWDNMQKAKHDMEDQRDKAWFGFFLKAAGVVATVAGILTGNPFLAALGISISLHETAIGALSGEEWGAGATRNAGETFIEGAKDKAGKALQAVADGLGKITAIIDAFQAGWALGEALGYSEALAALRKANAEFRAAVASGDFTRMMEGILDLAVAKAQALADADRKTGEPVPTPGSGGRTNPPTGEPTPTESSGGASTGGVVAPDGGYADVPTEIDPFRTVPITVTVKNFGRSTLSGAVSKVRVFKEPQNRSVLLVADESDGANARFEQALANLDVGYDLVLVDSEYSPMYADADPLTKDLKDYETVLWEASNDRTGTLQPPAQRELGKYLDAGGCLFVGGDGFMAEWPAKRGTLMSDWMFADGYGGDSLDLQAFGVPGTIGEGLSPVLVGGTGSSLQASGATLAGVKSPGQPAFLYNGSLAAIQGENETANGTTYKTILFSAEFASIESASVRDELMQRILDFLTCRPEASGSTPVPDIPGTWDGPTTGVPVTTTVNLTPGNYIATLTLEGADTNTSNNVAKVPITVKPARTVSSCGNVTESGDYGVTDNLTATEDCLVITADDVAIDGQGHSILFGSNGTGTAVRILDGDGDGVQNVTVSGLQLRALGPGTTGIFVSDGAVAVRLENLVIGFADTGVFLEDTGGAILTHVQLWNNLVGIENRMVDGPPITAVPNVIYDNAFANALNAKDPFGFTIWNQAKDCSRTNVVGGPCTGGNWWSDYTGVDLDADGIGDTDVPYTSGGNMVIGDFLPLVMP